MVTALHGLARENVATRCDGRTDDGVGVFEPKLSTVRRGIGDDRRSRGEMGRFWRTERVPWHGIEVFVSIVGVGV
jgi:hypothetical protein